MTYYALEDGPEPGLMVGLVALDSDRGLVGVVVQIGVSRYALDAETAEEMSGALAVCVELSRLPTLPPGFVALPPDASNDEIEAAVNANTRGASQ